MSLHPIKRLITAFMAALFVILSACGQPSTSPSPSNGALAVPFAVGTLPDPSALSATLDCPDGSSVNMALNANTASGDCQDVTSGNGKTFTMHFYYGTNQLELARASKMMDIGSGQHVSIVFNQADYDESFDADSDGYPNLYELSHALPPESSTPTVSIMPLTPDLSVPRQGHTATLLPNGDILLAGGTNDGVTVLNTAVIFDPAQNTYTATNNTMTSPRIGHTATLLPNGTVLIVGGQVVIGGAPLNTAEIYDPANQQFTALDSATIHLNTARAGHTATLLPDGTVLIAGGRDSGGTALASTELYDPASPGFTKLSATMQTARTGHTATRLPDGTVLITGGANATNPALASAEIYDPANKNFTLLTSTLHTARVHHGAGRLTNGDVLLAGGQDVSGNYLDSLEIYDAQSQNFMALGITLPTVSAHFAMTLTPTGTLLLSGGTNDGTNVYNKQQTYAFPTDTLQQWTWMNGASAANDPGTYGVKGVASASNAPKARYNAMTWTDASGQLWLFGGFYNYGFTTTGIGSGYLNDLWRYDTTTNEWAWMSGSNSPNASGVYGTQGTVSATNVPGARRGAMTWTDARGGLWLFGGYGYDGSGGTTVSYLNDLWHYDPINNEWTWVSGSNTANASGVYGAQGTASATNVPGARIDAASWIDASGNLWLFGGDYYDTSSNAVDLFNDLWRFDPVAKQWTWISGSNTANSSGVYGTRGKASAANIPGARSGAVSWIDANGKLWLFGGTAYDSNIGNLYLNDLWRYDPATNQWTWMNGSSNAGVTGVYGTQGVASTVNVPGARMSAVSWIEANGALWLFGGIYYDSSSAATEYFNDLWRYDPANNEWTWMSGSSLADASSVYGTLGTPSSANVPGARQSAESWIDTKGKLWLFGGTGNNGSGPFTGTTDNFNDLWRFQP